MRNLILVVGLLLSFSSFGADYVCDVRNYRVEIVLTPDTSTSYFLTDRNNYQTISHGFAASITKKDGVSTYFFYPGNADNVKLSFRTEDVENSPAKMKGYIETKARGFLLWDYMNCSKRN